MRMLEMVVQNIIKLLILKRSSKDSCSKVIQYCSKKCKKKLFKRIFSLRSLQNEKLLQNVQLDCSKKLFEFIENIENFIKLNS